MILIVITFFLSSLVLWDMKELFSCCVSKALSGEKKSSVPQYNGQCANVLFAVLHVGHFIPISILVLFLANHGHLAIRVL
jgi:hypothetical protein